MRVVLICVITALVAGCGAGDLDLPVGKITQKVAGSCDATTHCVCGDTLTASRTFTSSDFPLACGNISYALKIDMSGGDLTLDCNDEVISNGVWDVTGILVDPADSTDLIIKNCTLYNFVVGIDARDQGHVTIEDNHIEGRRNSTSGGGAGIMVGPTDGAGTECDFVNGVIIHDNGFYNVSATSAAHVDVHLYAFNVQNLEVTENWFDITANMTGMVTKGYIRNLKLEENWYWIQDRKTVFENWDPPVGLKHDPNDICYEGSPPAPKYSDFISVSSVDSNVFALEEQSLGAYHQSPPLATWAIRTSIDRTDQSTLDQEYNYYIRRYTDISDANVPTHIYDYNNDSDLMTIDWSPRRYW